MLKLLVLFILFFLLVNKTDGQEAKIIIKGQISNTKEGQFVYLLKGIYPLKDRSKWIILDSNKIENNFFSLNLKLDNIDYYIIALDNNQWCNFLCEPKTNIEVLGDAINLNYASISGSLNNSIYKTHVISQRPLIDSMNKYADSADVNFEDTLKYNFFAKQNQFFAKKIKTLNLNIIKSKPKSFLALQMMSSYYKEFSKSEVMIFLKNLPPVLRKSETANDLYFNKIQKDIDFKKISKFYDLKFFDTSRNSFNFSEFKDKIVLIDFWASWCKPCLANLPTIDTIFKKYDSNKLKILSISLDENIDKWKNAIVNNPTQWENVSDLKGWQGVSIKYFKIESIPRYMILNREGKLISSDVKLVDIDSLISQYIDKN